MAISMCHRTRDSVLMVSAQSREGATVVKTRVDGTNTQHSALAQGIASGPTFKDSG
jgi:hypothetical protein